MKKQVGSTHQLVSICPQVLEPINHDWCWRNSSSLHLERGLCCVTSSSEWIAGFQPSDCHAPSSHASTSVAGIVSRPMTLLTGATKTDHEQPGPFTVWKHTPGGKLVRSSSSPLPFLFRHLQHSRTQRFIFMLPLIFSPRHACPGDLPVTKERSQIVQDLFKD